MKQASIYTDIVYNENKPAIAVLLNTDFTKEIRIVFKENQLMKEHKTPFPIVIEIVEGEIDFGVHGERHLLEKGSLLALEGNIPHDLLAKKDSIVRLTLSKIDKVERVEKVID